MKDLHVDLSKCLAKADSFAPVERKEAERISSLSVWGEIQWARMVPPIRQELKGTLPRG